MAAILKILIPTYNRPEKISVLVEKLSVLRDLTDSGRLCIVIFDNSEVNQSQYLAEKIEGFIEYNFNGSNLGYHGNIRKCLTSAGGIFKWLVADDDDINVTEIRYILNCLEQNVTMIAGLSLPYKVENISKSDVSVDSSLRQEFRFPMQFRDAVLPHRVPFDFLSSFIIKTEIINRIDIAGISSTNDYFHSLVYCSCLRPDDLIFQYNKAVISYFPPDCLTWSLSRLIESKFEICNTLINKHDIPMRKSAILSEILKWAVFGRIGVSKIHGLSKDLPTLIAIGIGDKSVKNLLLVVLLVIPQRLAKIIVLIILFALSIRKSASSIMQRFLGAKKTSN